MPQPTVASYCTTFLKPEMLHVYRQVTGLKRWRNVVLTLHRENAASFPFDNVVQIPPAKIDPFSRFYLKYIRRRPPIIYRGEYRVLFRLLENAGADLMHVYFGHTGAHLLPFIEEWAKPCIVSFHGMDVKERPDDPGFMTRLRRVLQVVPVVLARSRSLADRLVELGCPEEKVRLNRTGIPLDTFAFIERAAPEDGAWHFVQACRLVEKKGLPVTLEAFAAFHQTHPKAQLTIAGDGPLLHQLEDQCASLGIREFVRFTGFLDQQGLKALYNAAHVFIHPSHKTAGADQEGVPNSMLEAMATGLPVLSTRHGGIPEAVEHGRAGLLVAEKDAPALLQSMLTLTAAPGQFFEMGRAAAESVRRQFGQEEQIRLLEESYDLALQIGKEKAHV